MDFDQISYYKDGVDRIIDLMRDTFGDYFKEYFSGQPENISELSLPCMMVSESQGSIQSGATGTDTVTETIIIILALNKKDDFGAPEGAMLSERKLARLIKGQDPNTSYPYEYYEKTVMYAIRKHITMDDAVLRSTIQTDFAINVRGEATLTQEAYVTVVVERNALVPQRD